MEEQGGDFSKGNEWRNYQQKRNASAKENIAFSSGFAPKTTLHTGAPLYLASKKVSAGAYIFDNQFVVKKGSQMCPVERKSCPPRVKKNT